MPIRRSLADLPLPRYTATRPKPEPFMNQNDLKKAVAKAAFDYVKKNLRGDSVIGVGTGFIVLSVNNCY